MFNIYLITFITYVFDIGSIKVPKTPFEYAGFMSKFLAFKLRFEVTIVRICLKLQFVKSLLPNICTDKAPT